MSTPTLKLYDGRRPLRVFSVWLLAEEHEFRLPRSVLSAASKATGFTSGRIENTLRRLGATVTVMGDDLAYVIPKDQRGVSAVKLSDDEPSKSGPLKFSDDEHKHAQERANRGDLSAYRERRCYRRHGH